MRVLVVPKWYPWPDRPVFGIFCREQARAVSREHDVVVLASLAVRAPSFPIFALSDGMEDGLRTLRLPYRRPRFRPLSMACQLIGMLVALRRLRREGWRPDIVHAHVYSAALPALVLARLSGAPLVVSEHFTGFERGLVTGYDRLTARLAFRGADLVAPVSDSLAQRVRELVPKARVEVVENVVDTEVFHPGPADGRSPHRTARLLTVAALAEKKGHRYLLDALASLPDISLELIGDGEERSSLERRAQDLGLGERVRFRGELPKAQVAEAMREADLFVLPSLYENLPCSLIEAAASGLPSVATAVGGVPTLIDPTRGVLCPPGDAAALAAAIRAALQRREQFDPGALAAGAQERFGYLAIATRWSTVYREVLARRN